jgi:tRNA-dependent cyclodipeptide synthase
MKGINLISDRGKNYHDCIVGRKLFIPISLGNHYYSLKVLRQVIENFISKSEQCVVFLCDRLRFLSYLIRGETNFDQINSNIRIQLDQMSRALAKSGITSYSNVTIANWTFVENDHRFLSLVASLEKLVEEDSEVRRQISSHCSRLLSQFYSFNGPQAVDCIQIQQQYIMEETALSVFMTEIRGFEFEIYRKGMGFVDYLYDQQPDALKSLIGRSSLSRKFIALEDYFNNT